MATADSACRAPNCHKDQGDASSALQRPCTEQNPTHAVMSGSTERSESVAVSTDGLWLLDPQLSDMKGSFGACEDKM